MIAKEQIETAASLISQAHKILVASHLRPDGDAVGSVLGLGLALELAGKDVQMVLSDGVPESFRRLEGADRIRSETIPPLDLVITVDCADMGRVGPALIFSQGSAPVTPDINIDHHPSNTNFGKLNLVIPEAAATAEILAGWIPAVGLPVDRAVASALLNGLVTDTIGFRTPNVTPHVLRLAADLVELGANLFDIYRSGLAEHSFEEVRFWGFGLVNLQREDRMVWTTMTLKDREAAGYPGRDDADLINILSALEDIDVVVEFVELGNGCKVSWRAQPGFDMSLVAMQFGGGGHAAASGATILGNLDQIRERVLDATRAAVRQYVE